MAEFMCWYAGDFCGVDSARENSCLGRVVTSDSAEEAAVEFREQDAENTRRKTEEVVWVQLLSDCGRFYIGREVSVLVTARGEQFHPEVIPVIPLPESFLNL